MREINLTVFKDMSMLRFTVGIIFYGTPLCSCGLSFAARAGPSGVPNLLMSNLPFLAGEMSTASRDAIEGFSSKKLYGRR